MKKLLCILLLFVCVAVSFTSCTEEEVKPKTTLEGGAGGGAFEPKDK